VPKMYDVKEYKNVLDYDFFLDYESGSSSYVSKVPVYHVSEGDIELDLSGRPSKDKPLIETKEELMNYILQYIGLWLKPYVIVRFCKTLVGMEFALFIDRGIRHRIRTLLGRYYSYIRSIRVRFKRLKGRKAKSNVLFVTITVPHNIPLYEAYRRISRRKEQVVKAFRRMYKDVEYISVLEVHEDGYPHIHMLLYRKKGYFKVFKYKNMWRFEYKRLIDKVVGLEGGFIDIFAIRSRGKVVSYLAKYLSKSLSVDDDDFSNLSPKNLTLLIARVFKVRVLTASRYFVSKSRRPKYEVRSEPSKKILEIAKVYQELQLIKSNTLPSIARRNELRHRLRELVSDLIEISPNSSLKDETLMRFCFTYLSLIVTAHKTYVLGYTAVSAVS